MIRKFKTEKGKTIYAVTSILNRERAKKLVARQTHEAASYYNSIPSFIKPYTDELDGLYFGIAPRGAKPCIAV